MDSINSVPIELTVVLGSAQMPIHQLLRMGRGAVIELDTGEGDEVKILANNTPIAKGEVVVKGDRIAVNITGTFRRSVAEAHSAAMAPMDETQPLDETQPFDEAQAMGDAQAMGEADPMAGFEPEPEPEPSSAMPEAPDDTDTEPTDPAG